MKNKILNKLFFFLYLFFTFFFFGEVLLRIFTPESLEIRININHLTQTEEIQSLFDEKTMSFSKNTIGAVNTHEYKHTVTIDSLGYRNPCFDKTKNVSNFLIGDSFVFGLGVQDLETLGCHYNKKFSNKQLYTIAAPGASIKEYLKFIDKLKNIKNKFRLKNPKINIVLYSGNDFLDLIYFKKEDYYLKKKNNFSQIILKKLNKILHDVRIFRNSYTLNFIKIILQQLYKSEDSEKYFRNYLGDNFINKNYEIDEEKIVNNLKILFNSLTSINFDFGYFIILPAAPEIDNNRYIRDANLAGVNYKNYDNLIKIKILKKICKKNNFPCLFLDTVFFNSDYYVGDGHLTTVGQKKFGLYLIEKLK